MGRSSSITLPLGATKVAADAFVDNAFSADVVSLTVPGTYTEIECGAFRGLTGLESLTAPFVGGERGRAIVSLLICSEPRPRRKIHIPSPRIRTANPSIWANWTPIRRSCRLRSAPSASPKACREIADSAFLNTYGLENLCWIIRRILRRIGTSAFESCYRFGYDSSLGVPIIPEWLSYVETIGNNAFQVVYGKHGKATVKRSRPRPVRQPR